MPVPAKQPLTREEAIADLLKWATDHGRVPSSSEYMGAKNGYDRETYDRIRSALGGSWPSAIEAAFGPDVIPAESWPLVPPTPQLDRDPEPETDEPTPEEKPVRAFAEIATEVERAAAEMDESARRYEELAAELIEHPLFGRIDDERP